MDSWDVYGSEQDIGILECVSELMVLRQRSNSTDREDGILKFSCNGRDRYAFSRNSLLLYMLAAMVTFVALKATPHSDIVHI